MTETKKKNNIISIAGNKQQIENTKQIKKEKKK
jgi:hypothetical protein